MSLRKEVVIDPRADGVRPTPTCIAMNPRDLNIMLIGYEGGVIAWDFQKNAATKHFEMILPPGAPGGGSYGRHGRCTWGYDS